MQPTGIRPSPPVAPPEPLRDRRELGPTDTFCFACHERVPCFTSCCADVNILLTPADVLLLARRTGLPTGEFLRRHALTPISKDLHLPVVMLRMSDNPDRRCSFVGERGCTVYEDRPWACRMYPVGMAVPPARAGVTPEPRYFLFEDNFCKGRDSATTWTVDSWRRSQGLVEREDLEADFRDIVAHPWFIGGRQLDPKRIEMFFMAAYDLDAFREFIFSSSFLTRFELETSLVDALRHDDRALLRFSFRWLRLALFGEPTLPVRQAKSA